MYETWKKLGIYIRRCARNVALMLGSAFALTLLLMNTKDSYTPFFGFARGTARVATVPAAVIMTVVTLVFLRSAVFNGLWAIVHMVWLTKFDITQGRGLKKEEKAVGN